jgi:hypothetical protein
MLLDASPVRRRRSMAFAGLLSTVASAVLFSALLASPEAVRVLLIVPPGADLVGIDRARSAVPPSQTALLVAESNRVRVKGGLEVVVDLPLASAPAADLVVLLAGEPGQAEEAFLLERRKTARAVLLPSDSPLVERLKGTGGGALILVGGSDAIPAVLDGIGASAGAESPAPRPTPVAVSSSRAVPAPPAATPTRAATGRVFDRYFSPSRPTPTPTSTPTPR